jgi:hypothetical protein
MATTNTNGRDRKSLAEQIDRLDRILDGLAEALNEAVASAVKEAVGAAVKEVVQAILEEVLTNPAVVDRLRGAATPGDQAQTEAPNTRLLGRLRQVWSWCKMGMQSLCETAGRLVAHGCRACSALVHQGCASFRTKVRAVRQFKVQLLTAVAIGASAGTAAYFAGPWLAAGVSAVGGFATTLAVQTGLWLRRTLGMPAVPNA